MLPTGYLPQPCGLASSTRLYFLSTEVFQPHGLTDESGATKKMSYTKSSTASALGPPSSSDRVESQPKADTISRLGPKMRQGSPAVSRQLLMVQQDTSLF